MAVRVLKSWGWLCSVVFTALWGCGAVHADQIRFRYVPVDSKGNTALKPSTTHGAAGERVRWFGLVREGANNQPRPTFLVTFQHPISGREITVPLALPPGKPVIAHGWNRITYNFGSYSVIAEFNRDGSVDVIYRSGLFRRT